MYLAVLEEKAKSGDAAAQFNLGSCYLYGRGVAKDEKVGAGWYMEAAVRGYVYAQCGLGW